MISLFRPLRFFFESRRATWTLRGSTVLLMVGTASSFWGHAATLKPETLAAWKEYVRLTEARIEGELESSVGFLVQDFQASAKAGTDRLALIDGTVLVDRMDTRKPRREEIDVPSGTIHHWRGSIFIPRVALESVLSVLRSPMRKEEFPPDVIDSMILDQDDDSLELYLKIVRKGIVTVMYNTNHLVEYRSHGPRKASSRSVSKRIAELANGNTPREREKPLGEDRGFLWRMNSYWRFEEIERGVLVECESLTLSRGIPGIVRPLVDPIVNGIARESMKATLTAMKDRISKSDHRPGSTPASPAS